MASGLLASFAAAIQASLSVLLVISYGGIAARLGLLDSKNGKVISKTCVKIFLPALLLVKLGSEMHPYSAQRYGIIVIWAFIAHTVSFLIGIAAHILLGMPDWITCAIMFNNTTSYPLLLVQSLAQTGILTALMVKDERTSDMVERAKSYFLIFSTISSCLTFAVGPRLIDTEHAPEQQEDSHKANREINEERIAGNSGHNRFRPVNERTGLLTPSARTSGSGRGRHLSVASITFFPSKPKFTTDRRRPHWISLPKWSNFSGRTQWWLLFCYDFLNAPLIGAVLGAIIGLLPPLHKAFFNSSDEGGIFNAWLTESLRSIAQLFVPLPLVVAGISLYTSYKESKDAGDGGQASRVPVFTTVFILCVRFLAWPVLSIAAIYAAVKSNRMTGVLGDDPVLWFAMMLMPTGPPAMKLITMIQVSDADIEDERRMAKILIISYIVSPVLAFAVVGALRASQAAV